MMYSQILAKKDPIVIATLLCMAVCLTQVQAQCPPWQEAFGTDQIWQNWFGYGAAVSGTRMLAGAPLQGGSGTAFSFNIDHLASRIEILPGGMEQGDFYGSAVDASGTRALIGASGHGPTGGAVFVVNTATGQVIRTLEANDGEPGDRFGESVDLYHNLAVVGAPGDRDAGPNSGSAYVFDIDTGEQIRKVTAPSASASEMFGESVSIYGDKILVGARWKNANGRINSGAAWLFDARTGQRLVTFTSNFALDNNEFGYGVSLSADLAAIGEWGNNKVHLFSIPSGQRFRTIEKNTGVAFGTAVDLAGDMLMIGDPWDEDIAQSAGAAYLYDPYSGQELRKLTMADAQVTDAFGLSVATNGLHGVVGAPYADLQGMRDVGRGFAYDILCARSLVGAAQIEKVKCKVKNEVVKRLLVSLANAQIGKAYSATLTTGEAMRATGNSRGKAKFKFKGDDAPPVMPNGVVVGRSHVAFNCR